MGARTRGRQEERGVPWEGGKRSRVREAIGERSAAHEPVYGLGDRARVVGGVDALVDGLLVNGQAGVHGNRWGGPLA